MLGLCGYMFRTPIQLLQGDITRQVVDAIVNAANSHLAGGGGVDGVIHRVGGTSIIQELRKNYRGCPTGEAVVTGAGELHARYVIHAVGPRWKGGAAGEPELLASAYRSSLDIARAKQCRTIAFPAISAGVYGYPLEAAAEIALTTVKSFTDTYADFAWLRFVLHDARTLATFQRVFEKMVEQDWAQRGFSCGVWTDPPNQSWKEYRHVTDELFMLLEGDVELEMDGKRFQPLPGQEILIPARQEHSVRTSPKSGSRWLYGYAGQ